MASSSTSMLLPASLSKKVLVLIVGEDGVGKTTLLQRLISLEDPFTSSTFFPPTSLSTPPTTLSSPSTSTSSLQTPFQFSASMAKISDTSLFTGVKIEISFNENTNKLKKKKKKKSF
ncbi:hypothetical protein HMI56_006602 [Coelomomyces lativittatus]|nr:hypothetical protein HMI56_006602 [Coelomomyces lativittatus]